MNQYVGVNGHKVGMVATITLYCAICQEAVTITEQQLDKAQYERIVQGFASVVMTKEEESNAKA